MTIKYKLVIIDNRSYHSSLTKVWSDMYVRLKLETKVYDLVTRSLLIESFGKLKKEIKPVMSYVFG